MKDKIIYTLAILAVCLFVGFMARLDFYFWRAEHPNAPTWTYFLHSSR